MKTPKEFMNNIKNHRITEEMLELSLYSVNKRAKNCRNQIRKYRHSYSQYADEYVENYEEKMKGYYDQKDLMLGLLKPQCIHVVHRHHEYRERIYDYDFEYKFIKNKDVIYENSYVDNRTGKVVHFKDVIETDDEDEYFLFYKTAHFSFHQPIDDIEDEYSDLKCYEIDLITDGEDIHELLSAQFVSRLIELIQSKNYVYV